MSPATMLTRVPSQKPWIWMYAGVLTRWAAVMVPSGMILDTSQPVVLPEGATETMALPTP